MFKLYFQNSYDFKYFITDSLKLKNGPKSVDENKTKLEEYNEAICEAKTNWLTKLGTLFNCKFIIYRKNVLKKKKLQFKN